MNNARKWIFEKIIAAENRKFLEKLTFNNLQTTKTAANSLALSFLKLYLIIPLINFTSNI